MNTHDEIVAQAVNAVRRIDRTAVVRAFVGSLETRNLPARSAFGSYAVLQSFDAHPYQPSAIFDSGNCAVCGLPISSQEWELVELDEWVANYPYQVQHTNIRYAAFDLDTFPRRKVDEPTPDAVGRLRRLLDALRGLPADAELSELQKSIGKAIKSNKHQRQILLESFGYAGILRPQEKRDYASGFVTYDESNSDQPRQFFKREWAYPVRFWTGLDGVNEASVASYFEGFL